MRSHPLITGVALVAIVCAVACSEAGSAGETATSGPSGNPSTTSGTGLGTSGATTQATGATAATSGVTTTGGSATTAATVGSNATTSLGSTTTTGAGGGGGTDGAGATTTSGGSSGGDPIPSTDTPSTDTTWDDGLASGPNGPIPLIVVDQFGYRTTATKVAVIRDPEVGYDSTVDLTPGAYAVVDKSTGNAVHEGTPNAWNGGATDATSGDRVWWFDFSEVTAPGIYTVVDLDNGVRSVEFAIDDTVYRSPLKHAVRTYYYQRAGFEKSAATAGAEWADGASHLAPGQDSDARAWTAKDDASLARDLRGGWYDAGDYNKYTAWTAGTAITLLRAYEEHPGAFGDDYGIAESGNGVPDLLDEVKWAIDWVERMQNPDGSLLCIVGLAASSPPSATTEPSYYGPATTNATLMGAAVFAYASKVYAARPEASLQAYARSLGERALQAWNWAEANPAVLFHNNDESKQPGSSGLGAGQQEPDDAGRLFSKFQAAMYLYEMTGDAAYRAFVEENYSSVVASWGPSQWDMERQDALLYLTGQSGISASVTSAILTQFSSNMQNNTDQLPMVTQNQDPYRAPMQDYTWGSNQIKMAQARLYQLLAAHAGDATAEVAAVGAEQFVHYLHGVNPLGLVYLTNMRRAGAEHAAKTMFHSWFADGTPWDEVSDATPGPAPGFLVGGPNSSFELDSCCTAVSGDAYQCYGAPEFALCSQNWEPPLSQPVQKSYLEFNSGWPAGSWALTEPSTGYQAKYILVLAAYAG